jgi:hypothetical protein
MTTTNIMIAFPHETLTPLLDRPTGASLQRLQKGLYANARSVHSALGGGDNGHLALVMDDAAYLLRAGAAWADPIHPGLQPAHAHAASQALIVATNRAYDRDVLEFQTCTTMRNLLHKQLLQAVNNTYIAALEECIFGYDDLTPRTITQHLVLTYGTLTIDDLENNRELLAAAWNPDDPIETLWARLKACQDYAASTTEAITDDTAMRLTLRAIETTGVLASDCASWRKKTPADRTLENFKVHFSAANNERCRQLTAATAGYHGAHQANAQPPPVAHPQANSAAVPS